MVGDGRHVVPVKTKEDLYEYFKLKTFDRTMAVTDTSTRRKLSMDGVTYILLKGLPRKLETVSLGGGLWEVRLKDDS